MLTCFFLASIAHAETNIVINSSDNELDISELVEIRIDVSSDELSS